MMKVLIQNRLLMPKYDEETKKWVNWKTLKEFDLERFGDGTVHEISTIEELFDLYEEINQEVLYLDDAYYEYEENADLGDEDNELSNPKYDIIPYMKCNIIPRTDKNGERYIVLSIGFME